jgi:pimeloyl-ACP methyl ester carboxylesterase
MSGAAISDGMPVAQRITLPERVTASGTREPPLTLSVRETGRGPAVVLCHGFPELAYSWRHQIPVLVAAGFRVIAPDQRGYGDSDAPEPVEAYDLEHLTDDLAALLDALGIERAVFAGHDWGGVVAWGMPVRHPSRVAGVIGVNQPYSSLPDLDFLRRGVADDEEFYALWFQQCGVAEAELDRHPRLVFEKTMRRGAPPRGGMLGNPYRGLETREPIGPPLLTEAETDVYTRAFAARGFRGPLNWYRNMDRNLRMFPDFGTRRLDVPCLMITAEWDSALLPDIAAGMPAVCPDLETHMIGRCGHSTAQDKPAELNALMIDWLTRRFLR